MKDYKKALDCLDYIIKFVDSIKDREESGQIITFDEDGEIIMDTDVGYWEDGNEDLRAYLQRKVKNENN